MVIYLLYSLGLVGLLVEGLEAGLVSRAFTGDLAFIFFLENSTTDVQLPTRKSDPTTMQERDSRQRVRDVHQYARQSASRDR